MNGARFTSNLVGGGVLNYKDSFKFVPLGGSSLKGVVDS